MSSVRPDNVKVSPQTVLGQGTDLSGCIASVSACSVLLSRPSCQLGPGQQDQEDKVVPDGDTTPS